MEFASDIPRIEDLFDLSDTGHSSLFNSLGQVWDVFPRIGDYLSKNLRPRQLGQVHCHAFIEGEVFVGEGTVIEACVLISGPAWIGRNCRIGHGASLRSNVIVGDDCVVGHAVELKNSVLFNRCEVSHFNYVGDSVLGHRVHLGAGAILSNYRLIRGNVNVRLGDRRIYPWFNNGVWVWCLGRRSLTGFSNGGRFCGCGCGRGELFPVERCCGGSRRGRAGEVRSVA